MAKSLTLSLHRIRDFCFSLLFPTSHLKCAERTILLDISLIIRKAVNTCSLYVGFLIVHKYCIGTISYNPDKMLYSLVLGSYFFPN